MGGFTRKPQNICKAWLREPLRFDLTARALTNFIDHLGKATVDFGIVLALLRGQGAPPVEVAGGVVWAWFGVFLSGTCYNPKVADSTLCRFEDATRAVSEELALPCRLQLDALVPHHEG